MSTLNQLSTIFETSIHRWVAPNRRHQKKRTEPEYAREAFIIISSIGKVYGGKFGSMLEFLVPLYFFHIKRTE